MSSDSNNNDDDDGMGVAYSTNEGYSNRNDIRSLSTNPVEYLEFVAEQEQFSPRNLSIHKDSLQLKQPPPPHEQFIHLKQAPINVNYIVRDDNSQQNLTNISNNNNNNNMYNPYFPPTEQQVQQFYNSKDISNQLSPLDEVVHNNPYPEPHQVEIINNNNNQQDPSQGYQYQQLHQLQQLQQFQQPPKPIPKHNNDNSDNNNDNNKTLQSPIDHSTVTPSPLALPGLYLTRNRSRISTPKIENLPRIPNAYTAQVQQSDSPLRTEFRNSEMGGRSSGPSKRDTFKNMLGEILNQDRLSNVNINERTAINEMDETLVKFDFRNANGDPDDPLLNKKNIPIQEEEQQLPTGLLNGNVNNNSNNNSNSNSNSNNSNNNNNNNNNNTLDISHQDSNDSSTVSPISPISPTSQVTPILKKSMTDDKEDKYHDVIIIGDQEIKLLKPKQGAIFMLIAVFVLAAIVFIAWKLGDWGVGDAKNIYNYSANNGVVLIYPSGTKKLPPISSNSSRKLKRSTY